MEHSFQLLEETLFFQQQNVLQFLRIETLCFHVIISQQPSSKIRELIIVCSQFQHTVKLESYTVVLTENTGL